ncbi:hypothetical protein BMF94_0059 [Rhodotorula taiwanensis]|uniref:Uncharacterized protein n=1 Tax=Rhodotorula taiwanensis TaxID=741276 RepID=A0A2S5BJ67_9BASI|nr:hypothetical protein BMF94_0059 [Rhodotorula taiwanensis]
MSTSALTTAPASPPAPPLPLSSDPPPPPLSPLDSPAVLAAQGLENPMNDQKQDSATDTVPHNGVLVPAAGDGGGSGGLVEGVEAATEAHEDERPQSPKTTKRTRPRIITIVKAARPPDELPDLRARGLVPISLMRAVLVAPAWVPSAATPTASAVSAAATPTSVRPVFALAGVNNPSRTLVQARRR